MFLCGIQEKIYGFQKILTLISVNLLIISEMMVKTVYKADEDKRLTDYSTRADNKTLPDNVYTFVSNFRLMGKDGFVCCRFGYKQDRLEDCHVFKDTLSVKV